MSHIPEFTQEQYDAVHELPLRRDVRWTTLPGVTPGIVIEAEKRAGTDAEAPRKFGAVDMGTQEAADTIARCHNEWLAAQPDAPNA